MSPTETDAQAIARSRSVPDAFVVLVERHHTAIHGYVRRRLGDSEADDAAAEVFARAFRRRESFRSGAEESARPWLFGIAAHVLAERRRAEGRRMRAIERLAAQPAGQLAPGSEDVDPDLVRALRRLDGRDREALLLLAWAELSYDEIATALDVPVGTVRSRIHRARRRLSAVLTPTRPALEDDPCLT